MNSNCRFCRQQPCSCTRIAAAPETKYLLVASYVSEFFASVAALDKRKRQRHDVKCEIVHCNGALECFEQVSLVKAHRLIGYENFDDDSKRFKMRPSALKQLIPTQERIVFLGVDTLTPALSRYPVEKEHVRDICNIFSVENGTTVAKVFRRKSDSASKKSDNGKNNNNTNSQDAREQDDDNNAFYTNIGDSNDVVCENSETLVLTLVGNKTRLGTCAFRMTFSCIIT